jgi:hypothetical protein
VGVVRAVIVLVLERAFVVGGEVVATRVLVGRGRDLDQISVAINQETYGAYGARQEHHGTLLPMMRTG